MKKVIGWQKYEEVLKEQMQSPLLKEIIEEIKKSSYLNEEDEETDISEENYEENKIVMPIPQSLIGEASLASNFDCWVAHTNFNITKDIRDKLNEISGVEILKIHSRYRFFIGIGKMFDFSNVRQDIEKALL
jgi:hypothetical protein